MIGGKLLSHVAYIIVINWLKSFFIPTGPEKEVVAKIKKLYKTHDVFISEMGAVYVKKKKVAQMERTNMRKLREELKDFIHR